MKKFAIITILFFLLPRLHFAFGDPRNEAGRSIGFMENKGQFADQEGKAVPQVLFKAAGIGPGIFITTSGITYLFCQNDGHKGPGKEVCGTPEIKWSKIEMQLENAAILPGNIRMDQAIPGYANFYYPHCAQGVIGVKTWGKITISSVYPGIDWVLNADAEKGLSYDFIVHPGADASQIRIRYKGAKPALSDNTGSQLVLRSLYGDLFEGRLHVFEQNGRDIKASFKLKGNELAYALGKYDKTKDLYIDPPLQWSKKEISSGADDGYALATAIDGSGDVMVTGLAAATDFPTLNAYQGTNAGNEDMVIFRMNTSGTVLWSTYYGGTNYEGGKGIATDNKGNCYVAGYTNSANFPVLNAVQAGFGGGTNDVALVKLDKSGLRKWATFYGGLLADYGNAIACDNAGNSYITGYTGSSNFPVLNYIQGTKNGSNDAFIMKLDSGSVVQWATYFGGDDNDEARAIALNTSATAVHVTGSTISGVFPVTTGVFQSTNANAYNAEDVFVLKMNASNAAVQFATFCGGLDADFGQGITVDATNQIYITGYTLSGNYPIFNPGGGAYVDSTIGSVATHDAFVTRLNPTGTACSWSTYLGGAAVDIGYAISYNATAGIYVTGSTASTDFPVHMPADNVYYQSVQGNAGSTSNFFIGWFSRLGVMQWSTYYGGTPLSEGRGIGTDPAGNIFVCGTDSSNVRVMKFAPGNTTGIFSDAALSQNIRIYPDPAQETLTLSLEADKEGTVKTEIFDMEGRSFRKESLRTVSGKNLFSIDVSQLNGGMYFLKLEYADKAGVMKFTRLK